MTRHVLHAVTNLLGDDPVSKHLRRRTLRLFGATIGADCHLHGGTFYGNAHHLHRGDRVFINQDCYLDLDAPTVIGNHVVIGHRVSIVTANHIGPTTIASAPSTPNPSTSTTASGSVPPPPSYPGVTIGPGAIIAAGAIVTTNITADTLPAGTLAAGTPARPVRHFHDTDHPVAT